MNKNQLRIKYKKLRAELEESYRADATSRVIENAKTWLSAQPRGFVSSIIKIGSEIDLAPLNDWVAKMSKHQLLLPQVLDGSMFFAKLQSDDMEEIVPTYCIVPCICYDRSKHRIGYGKGYYDKYLAKHSGVYSVIVNFAALESEKIADERWDVPVNLIINENGIF